MRLTLRTMALAIGSTWMIGTSAAQAQTPPAYYYYPAPGDYASASGTVHIPAAGSYYNAAPYAAPAPRYTYPASAYVAPAPAYATPAPRYMNPAPASANAPRYAAPAPRYAAPAYATPAPGYSAPAPAYATPTQLAPSRSSDYDAYMQSLSGG